MSNANLRTAWEIKNDEFYTLYEDIEKELSHYTKNFEGKVVYCPCDNPEWSNFWKFFVDNFHSLKLKKLIATYYDSSIPIGISSFVEENETVVYKTVYDGTYFIKSPLNENGDFRSSECLKTMKECDIVVTNPPFSLFREMMTVLQEYDKDFLLIGNQNAFIFVNIFPLLRDRKVRLGYNYGSFSFSMPNSSELKKFGCICWYTSFDVENPQRLTLTKEYDAKINIKYENYDAINVDRLADIPYDYDGVMGVPITFFYKWNPEQFVIIDSSKCVGCNLKEAIQWGTGKKVPSGKISLYRRYIPEYDKHPSFTNDGIDYIHVFGRIFIQRV